jgi:uncharacterized tellurite resistance protein B-like protein
LFITVLQVGVGAVRFGAFGHALDEPPPAPPAPAPAPAAPPAPPLPGDPDELEPPHAGRTIESSSAARSIRLSMAPHLDSARSRWQTRVMEMKDRLPLVADLLMDAAYADRRLAGDEREAVRHILRELLDATALPMDLDFRIDEFDPARFDLAATAGAFAGDPPATKRRLLELLSVVHAADGEIDFAEDEQLRRVGAALGLDEEAYRDLTVTIVDEVDLADVGENLDSLRYGGKEKS